MSTAHSEDPPAGQTVGDAPLVSVRDLHVRFPHGDSPVVRGVSFDLAPGRVLAIVGESGSGKSVTSRTLLGLAGRGAHIQAERLEIAGADVRDADEREWRAIRGRRIGLVSQDALVSLDPLRTIEAEVAETIRTHRLETRRPALVSRVEDLLGRVGVDDPEVRRSQYSFELSGGLRQRALIAAALSGEPTVLIADEPTTALDVTVQARILDLFRELRDAGVAILFVSHDLAVVGALADEVLVMRQGEIVERGPAADVLTAPQHPYTRALLDAVPTGKPKGTRLAPDAPDPVPALAALRPAVDHGATEASGGPAEAHADHGSLPEPRVVLRASGLSKRYPTPDGAGRLAVDDVDFQVIEGRTLGIVGESGSGKTTVARIALGLVAADAGTVELEGGPWSALAEGRRRPLRREIQLVPQDPLGSFQPGHDVERLLAEPQWVHLRRRRGAARDHSAALLEAVGLDATFLRRHPSTLSGGQRQRVAIARALTTRPRVLVCDEPVSALDVSVQAQVLDLLSTVQEQWGLSMLFISHDLGVIQHMSDDVVVMRRGQVVEAGPTARVLTSPEHDYTRNLLASLPAIRLRAGHPVP